MAVLFKGRIVVCRQHFAVGVYVDACAFGLLEEFFHILQVMAADQNSRIAAHADISDVGILGAQVCIARGEPLAGPGAGALPAGFPAQRR